ncbi:MAG: sterol desaturase family protein [Elainellaceae cyanobacterium]
MVVFIAFGLLVGATAFSSPMWRWSGGGKNRPHLYRSKPLIDWILDGAGLFVQGVLIPILQITVMYHLWALLLPHAQASLNFGVLPAFLLSFVGVDYLYYWNHRWLHSSRAWPIHKIHHTVTQMDVLGTSRNTLWSSFFIVYLWVHALMIYLLSDPTGYILGVSLTSALDLWRHSRFSPVPSSIFYRILAPWLMLPQDHAHHHQRADDQRIDDQIVDDKFGAGLPRHSPHCSPQPCNFGANLKLWDRLHHTYKPSTRYPRQLGTTTNLSLVRQLLFPF